jgi:drug/metabolite transporter (DMT)-like permease
VQVLPMTATETNPEMVGTSAISAVKSAEPGINQSLRNTTIGVFFGLATAVVWAGWAVATRFAMKTTLAPHDVTFLRYTVSCFVLLPVLFRKGVALKQIGLVRLVVMVVGAGAPFMLLTSTGMKFAPASHVATLMIGAMPLFVALMAAALFGQRFHRMQIIGFATVLAGVACIGGYAIVFDRTAGGEWRGDALFILCGILFAGYTHAQRRSGITALHAASLVSTCSFVVFAPFYFLVFHPNLTSAPWQEVVFQVFAQGIGIAVLGLLLYGEAVRRLGAARGAVSGSLVPGLASLFAAPLLGEFPRTSTVVGVVLVSVGVVLVTGVLSQRMAQTPATGR